MSARLDPTTDHIAPNEDRQRDDRQNDKNFDQHVFSFVDAAGRSIPRRGPG
jgi:hypothetical protein